MKLPVLAAVVASHALPPPPLNPGETVTLTANACALIQTSGRVSAEATRKKLVDNARQIEWRGPCHDGLAHGNGVLSSAPDLRLEFFYGRAFFKPFEGLGTTHYSNKGVSVSASPDAYLENPRWVNEISLGYGTEVQADGTSVGTYKDAGWPPDYVPKYSVELKPGTGSPKTIYCPNPRSPVGCEQLWREIAGPYIAKYKAVRAEVQQEEFAKRSQLTQLNAAREAAFRSFEVSSERAFEEALTVPDREIAQRETSHKTKLATGNAGQLYAMADEFERAGDSQRAAEALRALLTRFPSNALAVPAAQHLSALPSPRPGSSCGAAAEERRIGAELKSKVASAPTDMPAKQYQALMAAMRRAASAYARCPGLPNSAAKIAAYRTAYVRTAMKCAIITRASSCLGAAPNRKTGTVPGKL